MTSSLALVFTALGLGTASSASGGEWPQILGPERNGHAQDESIVDHFPAGGPTVVWEREVGSGLAGLAVAADTAVVFHRVDDQEVVEALDPVTGKPRWKAGFAVEYVPTFTDDNGPRCVPLIRDGRVYLFGVRGGLRCLNLETGDVVWSRETHREFDAPEGYFGAGSTPIIAGDRLLVNVGGRQTGSGVVAFELATGRTAWKSVADQASYSSPAAATVDGVRHVIFVTRLRTVSLNPDDGSVRFEFPFGQRGPTVNAASPLILDGHLFVTAHYGVGAVSAKIGRSAAETVWSSDDVLSSHYATPVAIGGKLYGIHGQERVDVAELRCIDPRTRTVHWTRRDFGYGSLIAADGKLLALLTDGDLVIVRPDPSGYREAGRARLFETTARALPALAGGRLYARDEREVKCIDLRRP
ncbi:MAG TPA: PQQ-binding-like beta-propeller repeat protein [Planctomycetaceae bacterium]|nr:PQQ-binding-like beta-propeller repeat protein [Planctomycetaceae bacterium]